MARIPMAKRLTIAVCNIVFPPVAVMLLTGCNMDTFINCILFILAVVPSHIHGFYISLTYFNRKRKVRKGIYPGDKHSGIWSDYVNNGGATRREVQILREERDFGKKQKRNSGVATRPGVSRQVSDRVQGWDDGWKEAISRQNSLNRQSSRTSRRSAAGNNGQESGTTTPSRSRSRSRSLTRQLSNRLEDHVMRRLTDREDRRRRRDDDFDNDDDVSTEVPVVPMQEVRRWR